MWRLSLGLCMISCVPAGEAIVVDNISEPKMLLSAILFAPHQVLATWPIACPVVTDGTRFGKRISNIIWCRVLGDLSRVAISPC